MKKMKAILSLVLVLCCMMQFAAPIASADNDPSSTVSYFVWAKNGEGEYAEPADDPSTPENEAAEYTKDLLQFEGGAGPETLAELAEDGMTVTVPAGYYIAGAWLFNLVEDSKTDLMEVAELATDDDDKPLNGITIEAGKLDISALTKGPDYVVAIGLAKAEPSISLYSGDMAGVLTFQTGISCPSGSYTMANVSDADAATALSYSKELDYWFVEYPNGLTYDAAIGETIAVYGETEAMAKWKTAQPAPAPQSYNAVVTVNNAEMDAGDSSFPTFSYTVELDPAISDADITVEGISYKVMNAGTEVTDPATLAAGDYKILPVISDSAAFKNGTEELNVASAQYHEGKLTVKAKENAEPEKIKLTITASLTLQGDYKSTGYAITSGELRTGDTFQSMTPNLDETSDPDYYILTINNAVIIDNTNTPVNDLYDITYVECKVLKKTPITITAKAPKLEGGVYVSDGYELTSGTLLAGDSIKSVEIAIDETSDSSKAFATPSLAVIEYANGSNSTANYDITYVAGEAAKGTAPAPQSYAVTITTADAEMKVGEAFPTFSATITTNPVIANADLKFDGMEYFVFDENNTMVTAADVEAGKTYSIRATPPINGKLTNGSDEIAIDGEIRQNHGTLTVKAADSAELIEITLTVQPKSSEYTGSIVTADAYQITSGQLESGDSIASVKYTGGTVWGEADSSISVDDIVVKNGDTVVEGKYKFTVVAGKVTVTAYTGEVKLTAASDKKTYDGTALTKNEVTASGLKGDDTVVAKAEGSATTPKDAGANKVVTEGTDKYVIKNKDGEDVTARYSNITTVDGKLTIEQKPAIVAAPQNKEVVYSGNEVTIAGSDISSSGLISGHKVSLSYKITQNGEKVTPKDAGSYDIELLNVKILDASNADVSEYYKLTVKNGKLIIKSNANSIVLTITAPSKEWVYDGVAHDYKDSSKITVSGLVDGDTISEFIFDSKSSITNVGEVENRISSVVIKDSNNQTVDPAKYAPNYVHGKLSVTPYAITVTAKSAEKTYDGKALVNKEVSVTKLANDKHTISIDYSVTNYSGKVVSAINPGVYDKTITKVKIMDGNTDVTSNYNITKINGTLTVKNTDGTVPPKTGDESNLGLWIAIMAISAVLAAAVVIIVVKKSKKPAEAEAQEESFEIEFPEDDNKKE